MCIRGSAKLTVFFDPPFWIGVFEDIVDQTISTCKIVFGPEPKDYEVYDIILKNYSQLSFSKFIPIENKKSKAKINPKRLQRMIKKQTNEVGIGTEAQQSLKAEYEANKLIRKKPPKLEKKN